MKILILNQHMDDVLGGSEIQCDLIAKELTLRGHKVVYGAMNSNIKREKTYEVQPIQSVNLKSLWKIINSSKPDLIYWRYNKKSLLKASLISKICNIPFVFSLSHINDVTKWTFNNQKFRGNVRLIFSQIKASIFSRINYFAYYLIDGVISLKEDLLSKVPKYVSEDKKIKVNNSMEIKINKNFKWRKNYIVWVANIKKSKNPEIFIDLARKLAYKNVDFLMIGKIQDEKYNYLFDESQTPDNLFYLGSKSVHEVDEILSSSLMMVHTCEPEGFGNNFIQSWLVGKPTITLYFDPDNVIKNNNLGVHSNSFSDLIKDVELLISEEKLRDDFGKNAKIFAEKNHLIENNIIHIENFFNKIIEEKK